VPNFNPFFNILHNYVPIVAKSAREDLLMQGKDAPGKVKCEL
jgi:hypothetical protein